jgi:amicyanin
VLKDVVARIVMQNIVRASLTALVVLALLAAGCGSSSRSRSTAATQTATSTHGVRITVVMKSLAFNPSVVRANTGQSVVWINHDSAPHNVIYVSGPRFASSRPVMRPGQRFSIKLTQAGTIHYFCSIHPFMHGTIVVSP